MDTSLAGKTFVVTGATSGIGFATAVILAQRGGTVIGIGRSTERCQEAEKRLQLINPEAGSVYYVADLSLQSQVHAAANQIKQILSNREIAGLDGLVNNVGTFTYWLTLTPEGFEQQWAVNHLASFRLTNELLPILQSAPIARVVTVSSDSHYGMHLNWEDVQLRRHYNGLRAYGQTKLANVLFTLALNGHLGDQSTVRAFAADPGLVKTEIGFKGTPGLVRWIWERRRAGGISPEKSAEGIVFLLTEPAIQTSDQVYWKHGEPKSPSRQALDMAAADRLWTLSERMCGLA